jgi:arylsulfatase A-like enzyme
MDTRPNILFVMTDHTNAQVLAPGSPCLTPNLDRLAAEGVRFGRCYTPNAICSPARASLMTGLYPSTHGMWDCTHTQRAEWVDVPKERFTYFSQLLAQAGYHNGYFGKWHVEQSCQLGDFGWHEHDHTSVSARCQPSAEGQVVIPKPGYRDYLMAGVDDQTADPRHPAFDQGIDFIRRRAAGADRPFCCFVSASEPHDPYVPAKRFLDMYDLDNTPLGPTLRDEPDGKPEVVRRLREVWQTMSDADWRRVRAAYWAVITFLDSEYGRLVEALKETGQYDNTIIVFTSDHGDMLGAHGLAAKGIGTGYEEVYNIPLIIRVPGMPASGEDDRTLTNLVDLGPTLLDLCGAAPLPDAQGRSLRPVLDGSAETRAWRDAYAEFFGQRFVYTQRLVWHGDWKYVFNPGGIDELYDLAADPHERTNLAADPAHRGRLEDMCKRMWRKMKAIGDDSLFNTQYATLRTAPIGPGVIGDGDGE